MKLAWISDIHADWYNSEFLTDFVNTLSKSDTDGVILTGDIATGKSIEIVLKILVGCLKPIYYIHGNHDFYYSSFEKTRNISRELCFLSKNLRWVQEFPVELNSDTFIIGHDGFYDARYGSPFHYKGAWTSQVFFELNDFEVIEDIQKLAGRDSKIALFNSLGDEIAKFVRDKIPPLAEKYKNIIFISHCPPFEEVSLYNENRSPIYSLPFFSNKALGEALMDIKENFPSTNFVTLFGHTHAAAELTIDNLQIRVARAVYGCPEIFSIIEI